MTLANLSAATAAKTSARGTESGSQGPKQATRARAGVLRACSPRRPPMANRRRSPCALSSGARVGMGSLRSRQAARTTAPTRARPIRRCRLPPASRPSTASRIRWPMTRRRQTGRHLTAVLRATPAARPCVQSSSTADTRSTATAAPAGLPSLQGSVAVAIATVLAVASPSGGRRCPRRTGDGRRSIPQGMGGGRAARSHEPRMLARCRHSGSRRGADACRQRGCRRRQAHRGWPGNFHEPDARTPARAGGPAADAADIAVERGRRHARGARRR